MTNTTTNKSDTRFLGLPKNRTGLFAADTIHEVKPTRNYLATVPPLSPQFRHSSSINVLFASAEQNHHQLQQYRLSNNEIQQYYPIDNVHGTAVDSSNDSRLTSGGIRNGFRPSTIRHQKLRLITAGSQRNLHLCETKDSLPKSALIHSNASAKLRSEIDHMNNKLIKNKESTKSLRLQNSRVRRTRSHSCLSNQLLGKELDDTSPTALSYSPSNRGSSASTHFTADRIHQRFSSGITHFTANTRATITNTSNQTAQTLPALAPASPPLTIREADENEEVASDYQPTHAYQIPQQSNVGSESFFLTHPSASSPKKTRSAKYSQRSNETKSVSCPFYVMYFTNLTMQQRQTKENNTNAKENDRPVFTSSSRVRKVPVNSRTSTAYPKRHLGRRGVNSPISMSTYSTFDDALTNSTANRYNKRFSTKTSPLENDNSPLLRDILRTSSWTHIQV